MPERSKYELFTPGRGAGNLLAIEYKDVEELWGSLGVLTAAVSIEEKWDVLMENYYELERDWLTFALKDALFSVYDLTAFWEANRQLARRLANLLSTAALYVHHLKSKVKHAFPELTERLLSLLRKTNEEEADYRLAQVLRNHLQHQDIPVGIDRSVRRADEGEPPRLIFSTSSHLFVEEILKDERIPEEVRRDLKPQQKEAKPLKAVIRHYVELLWNIHGAFRSQASSRIGQAKAFYESLIDRFSKTDASFAKSSQKSFLLLIDGIRASERGKPAEFTINQVVNHNYLIQKNGPLANLSRRFVSGEAFPE
jgi:hypothetical protein